MATAVLTRDPVDAQAYAAALAPMNVVAMPVTKTAPPADPTALTRAFGETGYDMILVASPRAAHELSRAIAASLTERVTLPDLPDIWAVGPATKRALDIARLPARVPPDVRDGVELAKHVIGRSVQGKRILVPRAEEGRLDALDMLRAAGAHVVDVVAYRTLAVDADEPSIAQGRELLKAGVAVCCLFAPSQVSALASIVGPLSALATKFCAIGETTAGALRSAGIATVGVAASPTPEGMAQAVRSVYPP
jgi:uroporphyrinogen-III synthase